MWYGVRKLRRASGIPGLWVVECLINWEYEDSKGRKHGIAAKASAQSEAPIPHAVSAKQSGCNDNKLNPSSEFDYQHIRRRISFKMAIAVR